MRGHSNTVTSVAISSNGQRIATGSWDNFCKIWDAANSTELLTLKGPHRGITSVTFSLDGQRIAAGSQDQTAVVWDSASGDQLSTLKGHNDTILSIAFSPDGRRILTGSSDHTARLWDAANGKELFTLKGHTASVQSVGYSSDGRRILTGSADQTVKVWDAVSGKELLTLKGNGGTIFSAAFSPDGQRVVTGSEDDAPKIWEAATVRQVALWQREEKDATQRLAVLQREQNAAAERRRALHANDVGAICRWLVLAPIPFGDRVTGAVALEKKQIASEASLRPQAGERVKVGDWELVWAMQQMDDYVIDFNQFLGEMTERSVAYAVCYVESEAAQSGLLMKVGSDDESKIYLNGKEIYRRDSRRSFVPDQDVVRDVELRVGRNVLVFKVVNDHGEWLGSVHLTDAAGQPVKGLRLTLDPGRSEAQ
jgi:WD40 repeat protein